MRNDYARFAELSNKGARELGFADTGAMWRSKYDMAPDAFPRELDRLWEHLRVHHPGRQRRLLASLAESGQQTPIVVVAVVGQPDRYVVIDGHKRITRGKNFFLAGGSEETHGVMRETIIKGNEQLDARGQNLADVTVNELRDMINDAPP